MDANPHTAPASQPPHPKAWYGRSDLQAVRSLATDWGLIALAIAFDVFLQQGWSYVLAVLCIGSRMQALAELEHEALHYNLFKRRSANDALEVLYSLPLFSRVRWYREVHIGIHHRYWRHYRRFKGYGYDVDTHRLHTDTPYFLFTILLRPLLWMDSTLLRSVVERAQDKSWRDRLPVLALHATVIALLAAAGALDAYLKYWLVPFCTVYAYLYYWICLTAHANVENTVGTRDSRGWLIRLLVSPHDFAAYHSLHHGYPGIPWFNLRKAHAAVGEYQDVVVNRGLRAMLGSLRAEDHRDPRELMEDTAIDYSDPGAWRALSARPRD